MTPQEIKSKAFDEIADVTASWESSDKKDRLLCILGQIDGIILMACNMIYKTSEKEKQKEGE